MDSIILDYIILFRSNSPPVYGSTKNCSANAQGPPWDGLVQNVDQFFGNHGNVEI
jgi:hypothetical protein